MQEQILKKQQLIYNFKAQEQEYLGRQNLYKQILEEESESTKNKAFEQMEGMMCHAAIRTLGGKQSPVRKTGSIHNYKTLAKQATLSSNDMTFSVSIKHINSMLKSKTLVSLLNNTRKILVEDFAADKVNFCFMERDSIELFKQEGGYFQSMHINHFGFNIALPSELTKEERQRWSFLPLFKKIKDVENEKCFNGKSCVWPIRAHQKFVKFDENPQGKLFMLIQLETSQSE